MLILVRSNVHEELSNLMSVLAWRRYFDCTWPIEIKVTQRKRQMLQLKLFQAWVILTNKEVSWKHTSLIWGSWRQEKVKFLTIIWVTFNQVFVNDAAAWWVFQTTFLILNKESLGNSFVDYDNCDFRSHVKFVVRWIDSLLKLCNLFWQDLVALSVTNTISVYDEICWKLLFMIRGKCLNCLQDWSFHVSLDNLLSFLLNEMIAIILTHFLIDASWETHNWLRTSVTHVDSYQHCAFLRKRFRKLEIVKITTRFTINLF